MYVMNKQTHLNTNEELARRYQMGDRDALKELIRRFDPVLKSKVYNHTRDTDSIADIVQECWYVIINNLDEVKFQIGFEAWALNIGRNKAVDWIRNQQLQRKKLLEISVDLEEANTDLEDIKASRVQIIKSQIELLPESQKIILELFYKDNFSLTEVSKILDISVGTAKSRLFNAREHLKKLIQT